MLELVVRLVLGGGVIVAAVLGLRWAQSRGMTARGGPELRVVGRTGLTRTSLVAVVAVDDRRFLVGAADQGVELLAELDPVAQDSHPDGRGTLDDLTPRQLEHAGTTADEPDGEPTRDRDERARSPLPLGVHGTDTATDGPRIGPLDRLRAMTVRTPTREPIRVLQPRS